MGPYLTSCIYSQSIFRFLEFVHIERIVIDIALQTDIHTISHQLNWNAVSYLSKIISI